MNDSSHITRVMQAAGKGDRLAASDLLPLVYEELRKLARARMEKLPPGNTLHPTALVHEAFMRLMGKQDPGWDSKGHFFAAAAESIRRILVERARKKGRLKRGGAVKRVNLESLDLADDTDSARLVELDEALTKLAEAAPEKATLVKLRYFAGLTVDEAAKALGISASTADRHWAYARAWLHREMANPGTS